MNMNYSASNEATFEKFFDIIRRVSAIVVIGLLVFTIFSSVYARAGCTVYKDSSGYDSYEWSDGTKIEGKSCKSVFGRIGLKFIYWAYGGQFALLTSTGGFEICDYDPETCAPTSVWNFFWNGYDKVSFLGMCLAMLWTLIHLLDRISDGRANMEFFIRMAIQFGGCIFIIKCGKECCASLIGIGNDVIDLLKEAMQGIGTSGAASAVDAEAISKMNDILNSNIFTVLSYIIELILPSLFMLICFLMAIGSLVSRTIELGIRTIFMPIGVADFCTNGAHSTGMRYLKQYLGCVCRGAAQYIVLITGTSLMTSGALFSFLGGTDGDLDAAFFATFGLVFMQLIVGIVMIGLMKKSDNIIREVFQ